MSSPAWELRLVAYRSYRSIHGIQVRGQEEPALVRTSVVMRTKMWVLTAGLSLFLWQRDVED